jgi:hypothetical protein
VDLNWGNISFKGDVSIWKITVCNVCPKNSEYNQRKDMLRRSLVSFITLCLLSASWVSVRAQTQDQSSKYFSETGHNVKGEFLKFYNLNPNAVFLYGYPITEEYVNEDGKTVQYFQRARFEYRADLPKEQRVQQTQLGLEIFVSTGPLNVSNILKQVIQFVLLSLSFLINSAECHNLGIRSQDLNIMRIRSSNILKKRALSGSRGRWKVSVL